jgi:hypothetical protein
MTKQNELTHLAMLHVEAKTLLDALNGTPRCAAGTQGAAAQARLLAVSTKRSRRSTLEDAIHDFKFVFKARLAGSAAGRRALAQSALDRVAACKHPYAELAPSGHVNCYACGLRINPPEAVYAQLQHRYRRRSLSSRCLVRSTL